MQAVRKCFDHWRAKACKRPNTHIHHNTVFPKLLEVEPMPREETDEEKLVSSPIKTRPHPIQLDSTLSIELPVR